jgi:hypothetical protein
VRATLVLTVLVALPLAASLTCCKSFSGIDPMTEAGWEPVHIRHIGPHNLVFVSYRDAERQGSLASVSVRVEAASPQPLCLSGAEHKQVRSEVARMEFDCTKHVLRVLRYTLYQNNNVEGATITHEVVSTRTWPYGPMSPLMAPGSNRLDWGDFDPRAEKPAWDIVATSVCARTAPQSAEGK